MRWLMVRACRGFGADREIDCALFAAARELDDVVADNLTRHMVWISARNVQPVEEMRETDCIGPLCVDRTIALAQLGQKLIA